VNPVESETIAKLTSAGLDFSPYIVPASYVPLSELGVSQEDLVEDEEDAAEEE